MAKTKLLQTNFSSGELSPLMLGRVDTTKYQNGAAQLLNFSVRPQGGAWYRQGTAFVSEVKDSTRKVIIQEFEFSDVQTYVIEFGHLYVRIYYNGGFVETSPGSGVPLEITTTYQESELSALTFAQSADVLYIAHGSHKPAKLKRLGANSWDLSDFDNQDGPYMNYGLQSSNTLTVSNVLGATLATTSSGITLTVPTKKTITSISATIPQNEVIFNCASHGFTTGSKVLITGLKYSDGSDVLGPNGNGEYTVTSWGPGVFSLDASIYYAPPGLTYNITNAKAQVSTASYFEYRKDNVWLLAKVTEVLTTHTCTCLVIQQIKADLTKQGVRLTFGTPKITSNKAGAFTSDDVGAFVRDQDGNWYNIYKFNKDDEVLATKLTGLIAYTYPTDYFTLGEVLTTAILRSASDLFVTTDVGRPIRLNYNGKQPWCKIIGYTNAKLVSIELKGYIPVDSQSIGGMVNNGATDIFKLGAWSGTTGYPKVVCFHEQRLWFGATSSEPSAIWASKSSDYEQFGPTEYDSTVLDNNGISYTIVSNKANPIFWLKSGSILLAGTQGAEVRIASASSNNAPITPTNITALQQTNNGSLANCKSLHAGTAVLFVQRSGRKMYELLYSFQEDSFVTDNMTVVNDHIFRQGGKVVQIAYQKEPNNLVWVLLSNGTLACMTYEKKQQVAAWHRHTLGGSGFIESLCVIPSNAGTEDLLYMVVKRTINGTTKRYIEYLTPDFFPAATVDRGVMLFLDSALQYSGVATTTITGATHLLNEVISVVADGVYIGELTVSNTGTITLPTAASKVTIGYKYRGLLQMLPLDGGSQDGGTAMGKIKRSNRTLLRLYNSLEFKYGSKLSQLDTCRMTTGNQISPSSAFFTGDKVVELSAGYDLQSAPYIVQDNPYPLVVLAIGPDTEVTQ